MTVNAFTAPQTERFWSKVAASHPDSCWPWTAGFFRRDNGLKSYGALTCRGVCGDGDYGDEDGEE